MLASLWNRRNTVLNDAAFDGLALRPHDRVLELGFGGGCTSILSDQQRKEYARGED
jgi:hypothetical protein